jgi:hypothetical protein
MFQSYVYDRVTFSFHDATGTYSTTILIFFLEGIVFMTSRIYFGSVKKNLFTCSSDARSGSGNDV